MDEQVEHTRLLIAEKTAVFCGLVRDCVEHLPRSLATVDSLAALFHRSHHVLLGNDFVDDSLACSMTRTSAREEPARFGAWRTSVPIPAAWQPNGCAFLRNACLDICRDDPDLTATDYMVILDMDAIDTQFTPEQLLRGFAAVEVSDSTTFFADQPSTTTASGPPASRFVPRRLLEAGRGATAVHERAAARQLYVKARQIQIETMPTPSKSSRPSAASACTGRLLRWLADTTEARRRRGLCGHVPFHAGIRANGGRLYIVPEMVNGTAVPPWAEPEPGRSSAARPPLDGRPRAPGRVNQSLPARELVHTSVSVVLDRYRQPPADRPRRRRPPRSARTAGAEEATGGRSRGSSSGLISESRWTTAAQEPDFELSARALDDRKSDPDQRQRRVGDRACKNDCVRGIPR